MKVHPVAEMFPMMTEEELDELAADIKENGLLNPIIKDNDGILIDGRNRLEACKRAGVLPTFETLNGIDPIVFIMSSNDKRRHMTKGQRAMIAAKVAVVFNTTHGKAAKIANAKLAALVAKRIQGDLTLLGFNIEATASQWAENFAESRRPEFHKVEPDKKKALQKAFSFYWYQDDRIIPIDEQGTQVFLGWATLEHWEAYSRIRNKKLTQFQNAESGFAQADKFIRANMPGHIHLRDLIKQQGL